MVLAARRSWKTEAKRADTGEEVVLHDTMGSVAQREKSTSGNKKFLYETQQAYVQNCSDSGISHILYGIDCAGPAVN